MNYGAGAHEYHFGYLPEGSYRLAFTCSGEWGGPGNDDYPYDPDGRFGFRLFFGPIEIGAGAWVGAKSILCPGVRIETGAVLNAGAVAKGTLEANGIYQGNPAARVGSREINAGNS